MPSSNRFLCTIRTSICKQLTDFYCCVDLNFAYSFARLFVCPPKEWLLVLFSSLFFCTFVSFLRKCFTIENNCWSLAWRISERIQLEVCCALFLSMCTQYDKQSQFIYSLFHCRKILLYSVLISFLIREIIYRKTFCFMFKSHVSDSNDEL